MVEGVRAPGQASSARAARATRPVRCNSTMPKGRSRSSNSSMRFGRPTSDSIMRSAPTDSTLPPARSRCSTSSSRRSGSASTVTIMSSRSTALPGWRSRISTTLTSLSSCLTPWSSGADSTSTTIVRRLKRSSSVGATARDSMLNPRCANRPATRASTPDLFSTVTTSVWYRKSGSATFIGAGPSARAARRGPSSSHRRAPWGTPSPRP